MENNNSRVERHCASKWSYDPLGRIFGGVIVIWLGVSFLLQQHDYIRHSEWWAYFLLGLGIIFLVEAVIRMSHPHYHRTHIGKTIAGAILVAIGAAHIYGMRDWWPLILIAIGIVIIALNLRQKRDI